MGVVTTRLVRCAGTKKLIAPTNAVAREPGWVGGLSTGPRTIEGKRRIAEAQRLRWREYREAKLAAAIVRT